MTVCFAGDSVKMDCSFSLGCSWMGLRYKPERFVPSSPGHCLQQRRGKNNKSFYHAQLFRSSIETLCSEVRNIQDKRQNEKFFSINSFDRLNPFSNSTMT